MILIIIEIFWFSSLEGVSTGKTGPSLAVIYHFSVFFLLNFFIFVTIKKKNKFEWKYLFVSIAISLIFAALDEIHQFFIPGRSCSSKDFFTDSIGILSSFFTCLSLKKIKK
jgi:VanZ family protein